MDNKTTTKERLRAHLKAKWEGAGDCTICGANEWSVLPSEYHLTSIKSGIALPLGVVICEACGAVNFFSIDHVNK